MKTGIYGKNGRYELSFRLLAAILKPKVRHALAQSTMFKKVFLQPPKLLVNQVVGLVNEADGNIGDHFHRTGFHKLAVKFVCLGRFTSEPANK